MCVQYSTNTSNASHLIIDDKKNITKVNLTPGCMRNLFNVGICLGGKDAFTFGYCAWRRHV